MVHEHTYRPPGLKLIIAYKFVKAPLMIGLAVWLTVAPHDAYHLIDRLAKELSEERPLLAHLGRWLHTHISQRQVTEATFLAWGDGFSTAAEGILLALGKAWGEWIVIAGLCVLIPFEILAVARHHSLARGVVLVINIAVVVYLIRLRLAAHEDHSLHGPSTG